MAKKAFKKTFIRNWRKHRGLTQEQLAERIEMSPATVSMLERGETPYNQGVLEAVADALMCEPVDLLIRNPSDPDGIWSIWDQLAPVERQQAVSVIRALKKAS